MNIYLLLDKLKWAPLCSISCKGALFLRFQKSCLNTGDNILLNDSSRLSRNPLALQKEIVLTEGPANFHSLRKLWSKIKSNLEYCTFIFQAIRAAMQL